MLSVAGASRPSLRFSIHLSAGMSLGSVVRYRVKSINKEETEYKAENLYVWDCFSQNLLP